MEVTEELIARIEGLGNTLAEDVTLHEIRSSVALMVAAAQMSTSVARRIHHAIDMYLRKRNDAFCEEHRKTANPMAATWTRAAQVRRAFKAGPPRRKDLVYSADLAVMECRLLLLKMKAAFLQRGIYTAREDLKIALLLMAPQGADTDLVCILPVSHDIAMFPDIHLRAEAIEKTGGFLPLGVAVWMRDRESETSDVWIEVWLTGERAARARAEALRVFKQDPDVEETSTF